MITILTDKHLKGKLYVKHLSQFFEVSGYEVNIKKFLKRIDYINPDKVLIDTKRPIEKFIPFFINTTKDIVLVNNYPTYYVPIFYRLKIKITPPDLKSITTLLSQPKTTAHYMDITRPLNLPEYLTPISFLSNIHSPLLFAKYIRLKSNLPTQLNDIERQKIQYLVNIGAYPQDTTPFYPFYRKTQLKTQSNIDK